MTSKEIPRGWFDRGFEAFKRSFPHATTEPPSDRFYVCPLCLCAYDETALESGSLSIEHIPPESVGGGRTALTCKKCNSEGGADLDSHMRREADLHDFATGKLREIKAELSTASGSVPVRLSASDQDIRAFAVEKAVHPEV